MIIRPSGDVASETFLIAWRRLAEIPHASFAVTEESWTGASRTRTIVNENLVFGFASSAGKKQWEEAGSPKLANPSGKFGQTGPVASNYSFGGYSYNIGEIKVGLAAAGKLPTTPGKLGALLRKEWNGLTAQQLAATVGFADPSYAEYLFQVAGALLTGPVTPGTRSAVYGLLAKRRASRSRRTSPTRSAVRATLSVTGRAIS